MTYKIENEEQLINIAAPPGVFAKKNVDFCTKLLLENVKTNSEDTLCDLGAGSGIVGIWHASRIKKVVFIESNLRAFKICKENIQNNQVKNGEVFLSDIFEEFDQENPDTKFSLILTNPPIQGGKYLTKEFIQSAHKHLKENGKLYLACRSNLPYDKYTKEVFGNTKIVFRSKRAKLIEAVKI